jgi:hypothetical protein
MGSIELDELTPETAGGDRACEIGRRLSLDGDALPDEVVAAGEPDSLDVDTAPLQQIGHAGGLLPVVSEYLHGVRHVCIVAAKSSRDRADFATIPRPCSRCFAPAGREVPRPA